MQVKIVYSDLGETELSFRLSIQHKVNICKTNAVSSISD